MKNLVCSLLLVPILLFSGCVSSYSSLNYENIDLDEIKLELMDDTTVSIVIGTNSPMDNHMTPYQAYAMYRDSAIDWSVEINAHLQSDFILIISHGQYIEGQWMCLLRTEIMTVENCVEYVRRELNSDLPVVLIVCNRLNHEIDVKNVYYADNLVWLIPDYAVTEEQLEQRDAEFPEYIGDFTEFTKTD